MNGISALRKETLRAPSPLLPRKITARGNSLAVQWLGLCTFTVKGPGSIPDQGTKIPHAVWPKK